MSVMNLVVKFDRFIRFIFGFVKYIIPTDLNLVTNCFYVILLAIGLERKEGDLLPVSVISNVPSELELASE